MAGIPRPADSILRAGEALPPLSGQASWYDFDGATLGDGDEVVPAASAMLAGVEDVEVPFSAVSWFSEYKARFFSFHAFLPTLDEVQTVVARGVEGQAGSYVADRESSLVAVVVHQVVDRHASRRA